MRGPVMAVLAILIAAPAMGQEVGSADRIQNVQLTFHLIEADGFQDDDVEIRPIVTELRKLFRFEGYRLLSKSVLHATANPGSEVSQQVADNDGRMYNINAHVSSVGGDLAVSVTLGMTDVRYHGLIDASVRLQHGKTVVLGSARLSGQSGALILAVTPTIDP